MNVTHLIISSALLVTHMAMPMNAHAVATPVLPVCTNPQGTMKAQYENGTHGIVGDTGVYQGKDTVYSLSNNDALQCFCPPSGNGIQTNWLSAQNYSSDELKVLVKEGWVFVPNGSAWGLADTAYVAKNMSYSCSATPNTSTGGTPGNTTTTTNNNSQSGSVLGAASSAIQNLASTGNLSTIFTFLSTGIIALLLSVFLRKKQA